MRPARKKATYLTHSRKNRSCGVKKGHSHFKCKRKFKVSNTGKYVRWKKDQLQAVAGTSLDIRDTDGEPCDVHLLRPSLVKLTNPSEDTECQNDTQLDSYRIWHAKKTQQMFAECYRKHKNEFPACDGSLELDVDGEEKRGLAWRERLKCLKGTYLSKYYELYNNINT